MAETRWRELHEMMLELEASHALGGIVVVVAERLRQVRAGHTPGQDRDRYAPGDLAQMAAAAAGGGTARGYASGAALLAAELDRAAG
jgi:hypothetical protein